MPDKRHTIVINRRGYEEMGVSLQQGIPFSVRSLDGTTYEIAPGNPDTGEVGEEGYSEDPEPPSRARQVFAWGCLAVTTAFAIASTIYSLNS